MGGRWRRAALTHVVLATTARGAPPARGASSVHAISVHAINDAVAPAGPDSLQLDGREIPDPPSPALLLTGFVALCGAGAVQLRRMES